MSKILFEDPDNLLLKLMLIKESSRTKIHTKIHNMEWAQVLWKNNHKFMKVRQCLEVDRLSKNEIRGHRPTYTWEFIILRVDKMDP